MYVEETKRNGSVVEHDITADTLDNVIEAIKKVIAAYHPLGYGTTVVKIAYRAIPLGTGYEWHALVRRSSSCE